MPKEFEKLKKVLEKRYEGTKGKREYIRVLELLKQHTESEIKSAIKKAFIIGAINVDSIKQILYQKKDVKIGILDKESLSSIPVTKVYSPSLEKYNDLIKNNKI